MALDSLQAHSVSMSFLQQPWEADEVNLGTLMVEVCVFMWITQSAILSTPPILTAFAEELATSSRSYYVLGASPL